MKTSKIKEAIETLKRMKEAEENAEYECALKIALEVLEDILCPACGMVEECLCYRE